MPNIYVGLDTLKQQAGRTTTTDDATLLLIAEAASRWLDEVTGRRFYATLATRYFERRQSFDPHRLRLGDDLISFTSLTVSETTAYSYETSLTVDTHAWMVDRWKPDDGPYRTLELIPGNVQLSAWPTLRRSVKVTGTWGYSYETETAGTLGAAISSTSVTTCLMVTGHTVQIGDTIVIGTEQLHVTDVDANTLTVTRGANGTTAATALISAAVSRRRYPRPIEQAIAIRVAQLALDVRTGGGQGAFGGDGLQFDFAPMWRDIYGFIQGSALPAVG